MDGLSTGLYMQRCFELARLGSGNVAPNPLVGAVLVHNDRVISEGYHAKFGGPHAEVMALKKITDQHLLEEATLYVNLEPCSHTGKTPPCTDLIISKGIKHVVIANQDPFPKVNGSGIKKLELAGVTVTRGILEAEGSILHRRFFTFHKRKRPYIILKWAQTKNGFIAPLAHPEQKGITWISNPASRMLVHRWRSEEQSILVGSGTILADNPRLTVRGITGNHPLRLVLDPELMISGKLNVLDKSVPTYLFNSVKNASEENIRYIKVDSNGVFIDNMLDILFHENIQSVLVEGGANTLNNFINAGLWDEARIFTGESSFEKGIAAPEIFGALYEQHNVAGDLLEIFFNQPVA